MKKRLISLILPIIALVLEILPSGAVLNFKTPHETVRRTFSYFSPIPYGYANFGPLITAYLTCALIVICIVFVVRGNEKIRAALMIVSVAALFVSVTPIFYGIQSFSFVGALISFCMLGEALAGAILLKPRK